MSSQQPQQTDAPKVTFRESWQWHAAEEEAPPKLNVVLLLEFFGLTTTSKSEPDALTKEMSERDKEKSERDALTIAMEFKTPESERETSKKETGQKRSVAEKDAQSPLNPSRS